MLSPRRPAKLRLLCPLLTCLVAIPGYAADTAPVNDLDAYVAAAMRTFEVPGLAVAVVKNGEVVLTKGYGVRRMGESAPVDAHTLFGIASNTKAFTAAALGILVDEGKIAWDDPVTRHLPWFQMYDPYVTREMTVRDLLCHRSGLGLGAGDLMFWPPTTFSRDEILHRLRFIKPAHSLRSKFAYSNLMFVAAGQIIPAVTGMSWEEFIRQRIFVPLKMESSQTSVTLFHPGDNAATPHSKVEGHVQAIPYTDIDNSAPAGAINSCVADMSRWVMTQLASGRIPQSEEKRLFSGRVSKEMWSAQTPLPVPDPPPGLEPLRGNFSAYGLGWGLNEFRGHKVVSHTGGLPGFVSLVMLIPDVQLGIVVLTNQEAGGAFSAIGHRIADRYLGAPDTDWIAAYHNLDEKQRADAAEKVAKQSGSRNADSKPSLALAKYAGRYSDPWYGEVTIAMERDALVLRFNHTPGLVADMDHWQYDTFKARWRDRSLDADAFVTFALNPDGAIAQMKMVPVSPLTDFSFDFQDLSFTPVASATSER
jgi:CubicO group peptidase (beta-lactamase class C family)